MLKRLYVHNYKCLVNFEINFDQDISLFLGANGSGKSTVFEVLSKLRRVIFYKTKVDGKTGKQVNEELEDVFEYNNQPRWLRNGNTDDIKFELDINIQDSIYKYSLDINLGSVEQDKESPPIIKEECLFFNGNILVKSNAEKTLYFNENGVTEFEFNKSTSCIQHYCQYEAKEFWLYFQNLFFVRINPYSINSYFQYQDNQLNEDSSNFAEWISHLNEENRKGINEFENAMRHIMPEYEQFRIVQSGRYKQLVMDFKNGNTKKPIIYSFEELSEGQKSLFALYALIYCAPENSLICIDEPENFLALPEIQPWLNELRDKCKERNLQALLISHHPSLINFLAPDSGYWFSRQENHTTFEKITEQEEDGLSLAQLIEMGWIYGD